METDKVALDIYIQGDEKTIGDFPTKVGGHVKILVPVNIKPENIKTMTRDTEIILDILRNHPIEVGALLNSTLAGDSQSATWIANMLGISEKTFQERGGGPLWVVILVIVLLYKACEGTAYVIVPPAVQDWLNKVIKCRMDCSKQGLGWGTPAFEECVNTCLDGKRRPSAGS